MTHQLVSFGPDDIRGDRVDNGLPGWARSLVEQILAAAEAGQTVTDSAEEPMLTPQQIADRFGVHRSTITRKILAGEISAVRVGNRHRVPYSEFRRFRDEILDEVVRFSAPDIEEELFGGPRGADGGLPGRERPRRER